MSIGRYAAILSDHSPGFFTKLLEAFFRRLVHLERPVVLTFWGVLAGFVLTLPALRCLPRERGRCLCTRSLLILSFDVIYILSLLFAYCFSFTEAEAFSVASFSRYFSTIVVSHTAVLICLMLELLCALPRFGRRWALCAAAVAGIALLIFNPQIQLPGVREEQADKVLSAPNDWYVRQLSTAVDDRLSMQEEEQYILWLCDRTNEPPLKKSYKVSMYMRVALASRFCVPVRNTRVLDLEMDGKGDIRYVLKSYKNRENAVVVLTDPSPEALEAAQKLNIPIYYGSGVPH